MKGCLVLAVLQGAVLVATLTSGPAAEFSQHQIVRPSLVHSREKRHLNSTRIAEGINEKTNENNHVHDLAVSINISGEDVVLDLKLNQELLGKSYFVRTQGKSSPQVHRPSADEVNLCEYNGKIRGKPQSWAAISTCSGLSGTIFDGEEIHYIEPKNKEDGPTGDHFLYRHSSLESNHTCGFPDTPHVIHPNPLPGNRFKRSVGEGDSGVIRAPYNSNKQSRYVELVFVVDNEEFKQLGSVEKVHNHCKNIANIINALYSPLNIYIALIGIVIWTERDEIKINNNGDETLSAFLHYRRVTLVKEHPNDNAQLLTRMQFDGGVVGKALKGPICTFEFSGGISVDHSATVGLVATTVAHEMGHNFGMEHDTSDCNCPTDRCIMAPSSNSKLFTHWSDCSLEYLAHAFEHGMDYCLRNKPEKLFGSPVCGNDFVEPGEQCDCGLPEHCKNPCCNAATCMLHSNATCATGKCCDLDTCRPKRAGIECRSADHECDLPEFCTGESEFCPDNVYKIDGELCNKAKAYCFKGTCRTHSDQCKLLWGPSGQNSESKCYEDMNIKGSQHGNCGFNRLNHSYIKCERKDVLCGMLHCKHLNERLEFGMESVAILSQTFLNTRTGGIIACRNAIVDLGLNEVDPGLAPDGAKCGEGKMCVNQKCMAVESLVVTKCENDCNGNGVCNSMGQCHCNVGYAPPDCISAGFGGSLQSGPASDPNGTSSLQKLLIFVLAAILMIMVLFFTAYLAHSWRTKRPVQDSNSAHSKGADISKLKESISRPLPSATSDSAQASLLTATEQLNALIAQHQSPPPPPSLPNLVPIRPAPPKPMSPPPTAPEAPPEPPKGYQAVAVDSPTNNGGPLEPPPIKVVREGTSTLSRIASMLKPVPHGQPPAAVQARNKPKINRENLRSLHISEPIPLQNIEVPGAVETNAAPRPVVLRAHSMRDPQSVPKAPLTSFGSMRAKRPTSLASNRPSAPPPRPPPQKDTHQYDDCGNTMPDIPDGQAPLAHIDEENSPTSGDNIYAVIEESPPPMSAKKNLQEIPRVYTTPNGEYQCPKPPDNATSSGSLESVGLLSEIVSEMQARNIESIYTTSSIKDDDKRCPSSLSSSTSGTYVNAMYTNMPSNSSPTPSQASSNQYLRPSAMAPPALPVADTPAPFSTFRTAPKPPQLPKDNKVDTPKLTAVVNAPEDKPKSIVEAQKATNGPKPIMKSGQKPEAAEKPKVTFSKTATSPESKAPTAAKPSAAAKSSAAAKPSAATKPSSAAAPKPPSKPGDRVRPQISGPTLISSSAPAVAAKPTAAKAPSAALVKSVLMAHEGSKMAQRPLPEKPVVAKVPPPPAARKTVGPKSGGPDLLAACDRPPNNRGPDVLEKQSKQPPPPPTRANNSVAALQHKFESRGAK
ncbi:disintegrin and metalloproteinase domain-containing protein 12 [Cloeon dipterum]|uniref:disintegrin and metalloproteinase domain-containing protein 12 n=1 Tax=Cloeon dipterum TaxID=197152 RepID=UPI00321F85E3